MIDNVTVELSRLQFGLTALYHFLFVPLTLGLSILLGIFESVYVMTGRTIWRDITKYWGLLFGINFAMGVATGITMEFQFGTNWAYYSHYVGDIFGVPLAIEGLMAFFLEASFIGLFFFGWDRLSRVGHLVVTWLVALGSNLSALWILVANGWMQHPVGAKFNPASMRMEVANFSDVLFNPVAQAKFVHTVSAGYVTGSIFVMAISAWFLLKGRNIAFAKRSMTVAASFGLASALSVVVLGDESGYSASENQKMKLAAIEAMWQTEAAPASFTAFGFPDLATHTTHDALEVPWVMGLIGTRSFSDKIPGILNLVEANKARIASGEVAYGALGQLRKHPDDVAARTTFNAHVNDLGYGLLLKRYTDKVTDATPEQVSKAAWDTVPNVPALFWTFRIMVGLGFFFIAFFGFAFWLSAKHRLDTYNWFLRLAVAILPLPWIAAELGWFVAENGRQPWTIDGILPTFLSASSLTAGNLWLSLGGFILFYSVLAVVELYLMIKYIKLGPDAEFPPSTALGAPALSLPEGGR
ncbi:cytochrome d terminal oxidase subunit 1 [Methylovirgula ligni]|uniref:Cytochrome bd-I ubiquinol oxidase subunit 1 apoprotein n=1 Tax=Methylovirgula ligni TaxID=569860 RepID=A0A3D9Z798_9HYPH|nr:cytochrome ubiquinol oxidase subunit I [Methylovirgula ligni]QAY95278.1 cytochrome d terminal oxidase subunit 1 [Methylovirgula ligni]REF89419.1 cytochrome bd-I ubiquinol oxidase subunit 1 apoprotein [Methylovirgula ligni]